MTKVIAEVKSDTEQKMKLAVSEHWNHELIAQLDRTYELYMYVCIIRDEFKIWLVLQITTHLKKKIHKRNTVVCIPEYSLSWTFPVIIYA